MMEIKKKFKFSLYLFTIVVINLIIGFIVTNQHRFIYNAVAIYIVYVLMFHYRKKGIIKISKLVNSLLVLVTILHLGGGQYYNLYETNLYFDKALHLIGTFTVSLFTYQVLVSLVENQLNARLFVFVTISSIGITLGVFLEILEFSLDAVFNGSNQKSLIDTNFDLIFDMVGASLAGLSVIIKKD